MDVVPKLLEWFHSSGGHLDQSSVGFSVFPDCGRGAVALKDIPEGHVLFRIPRGILLSTETSTLPGLIGLDRWRDAKMHMGWVGLILCMMWETAQGSTSKWSGYLDSLPKTFDTPMFWSDVELAELKGTSVVDKLGKADAEQDFTEKLLPLVQVSTPTNADAMNSARRQSRPDIFPSETIPIYYTLEIYHVMGSRILSRSFDVEKDESEEDTETDGAANTSLGSAMDVDLPQEETESVHDGDSQHADEDEEEEESSGVSMVPLADMLNARYGSENAKLFYEKEDLRMVSTKLIKSGEQIWNTYGDLPNAELLRRYGHVDMLPLPNGELGNPGDVVEITADLAVAVLQTDEAMTKERIDWWLEQGGDDVVVLESDLEIPLALVSLIRLLRLTSDEWEKTVAKDKVPKPKLDNEVLDVVRAVLERRLNEYPSTLNDDIQLLGDETLSLTKRLALVVRTGEKRILQNTLQKIKIQQLDAKKGDGNRKRKADEEVGRTSKTRRR
ncbi:Ribosomal lysine N-methyltransferase 4 [Mycena sanguinolenta]|uniref:Ribosomal lysine N-methyltransferase 4 n=1 Tax=Mycena sanguinolenta TaxID=230812 RepID=A0A8H7DLC2_9AGAR|nr:Ribosomal lysine N-methyltransferase 4 [Mycena sanguinolenta]